MREGSDCPTAFTDTVLLRLPIFQRLFPRLSRTMLGRQSLDEVFKSMCSSRNLIEQLEKNIGRKPDYSALRRLQEDPGFNDLSDHVFSMLTPLADSEETALCCILRMRESEYRVLQQLHSKLQIDDSSKLSLEKDIKSRRKVIEILKYALKLNQQENAQGVPLNIEDETDDLDTDAANMCQRIVQRRLNYLEFIADGSNDGAQQLRISAAPKPSDFNQRLAETAKNVERSLNSLGGCSELSMHDLDASPVCAVNPPSRHGTSAPDSPASVRVGRDLFKSFFCSDASETLNRFDLKCADSNDAKSNTSSLSLAEGHPATVSSEQSSNLTAKFEFMTAIPKSRLNHPLSTSNIAATFSGTSLNHGGQKPSGNAAMRPHAGQTFVSPMRRIAPFAMVKQSLHHDDAAPMNSTASTCCTYTQTLTEDDAAIDTVRHGQPPRLNFSPFHKSPSQSSCAATFECASPSAPSKDQSFDLPSYSASKSTVLKIRSSSIGHSARPTVATRDSPIRYVYADLVHAYNSPSSSEADGAALKSVSVTRPLIMATEGVRSPRKYEAQISRMRSASVGRTHASEAPLFRESYYPVMKQGSHLELRSPNDRFATMHVAPIAANFSKNPDGWV